MNKLAIALVLTLALAACGAQATGENYAKIKSGMTPEEVYKLIGKPTRRSGGGVGGLSVTTETFKGPENLITVTFANGKVAMKTIGSVTDENNDTNRDEN